METLKEFTQERIFGPVGMTGTDFDLQRQHCRTRPGGGCLYAPLGRG